MPSRFFLQLSFVQQVSFLAFARGVAHHAGGATNEGNGFVTGFLQVYQQQDGHQAADMQAFRRGVKTYIGRGHLFFELLLGARDLVMNHAPPR